MKTKLHHIITLPLLGLAALALASTDRAAAADFHSIISATSATSATDFYTVEGLIEGPSTGFSVTPPFNRVSGTTWVTNAPNGFPGNYFDPLPDPAPKLVFDLGQDVPLAEISTWGYATGIEGNSLKQFSLKFATDAEGPDAAGVSIAYNPTFTASAGISPRSSALFGRKVTARYVEMTPLSNYSGEGAGGDRVGFGEVAFEMFPDVTGSYVDLPPDFALGNASFIRQFTLPLRNLGAQPLTLSGATFTGDQAAAYSVVELPATLAPYSAGTIKLQFNPVGVPLGDASIVFSVNTNTIDFPVSEVYISAAVPAEPADQFYPITGAISDTDATDYFKVPGLITGPGVGFGSEQPHDQIVDAALWVTNAPNGGAGDYFSPAPEPAPRLVFDLGANVPLGEISVWGYSGGNANGVSDFKVRFATAAEGEAGMGTSILYNPLFTTPFGYTPRRSFDLDQVVSARFVEITPLDNYFGTSFGAGGDRAGFGEIAFEKIIAATGKNLIFPASVSFPNTPDSTTLHFVLKNHGTETVAISSSTLTGANAASFTILSAPTSLPPLSQAPVEVRFNAAAATFGPQEASFEIVSNDTANPFAAVFLTGEYVNLPDEFYPITSVTSDTEITDFYKAGGLRQGLGVGFSAQQPHGQLPGADNIRLWVTDAPNGSVNYFEPAPDPAPLLIFDLGEEVPLSEISVWGYAAANSNGARDFSLTFATAAEGPYAVESITYNPVFTAPHGETDRASFLFDRVVTAQYVLLKPLNNWGGQGAGPGGDRVGLGEVAFQKDAAIAAGGAFAVTEIVRNPAGQTRVSFRAEEGFRYTLQRSLNLQTWSPVAGPVTGTAGVMELTDAMAFPANASSVFYRVLRDDAP